MFRLVFVFDSILSFPRRKKFMWWTKKQHGSEFEIYQTQTRRKNRVFEFHLEGEESQEQAKTMSTPIPANCLELDNIDSFTPQLKNVIPSRHSSLRLIQNLKEKSNKSTHLIFIPASLLKIGEHAFSQSQIKSVLFARNAQIQFIDRCAFYKATNVHSVHIPSSIRKLGERVFEDSNLKFISFPPATCLKVIPSSAFLKCPLVSIEILASVERI